ncbi:MAG: hypothetical protein EBX52_07770 [Proteobacteria bacterium]|nr:hypothetical protein [Pseudomonadota bacterium]
MSRFDPESYRRYRVTYPESLFHVLRPAIAAAAGAGSALSFQRFYPAAIEFTWVDPDPAMLEASSDLVFPEQVSVRRIAAASHEWILQPGAPVDLDLALIGSAWHWMNASATLDVLSQVLVPGGGAFVFEYQFPKAVGHPAAPALNEWTRREFNLKWRDVSQVPRGSLRELTACFLEHRDFSEDSRRMCVERVLLGAEQFFGVIVSQSRYLAFERGLPDDVARRTAREALLNEIRARWPAEDAIPFEYGFEGFCFRRRVV